MTNPPTSKAPRDSKFVPVTDWFHGYRDVVLEQVYAAAKDEPPKN